MAQRVQTLLKEWKLAALDRSAGAWVFPSENPRTPLSKDNVWRRNIKPLLESIGLEWANFHVMRRTHSNLMKELGVDPKLVADQQGHTLDVNLNVYTATSVALRKKAVDKLENKLLLLKVLQLQKLQLSVIPLFLHQLAIFQELSHKHVKLILFLI